MSEGGGTCETDSDETIVEGSVPESDGDEEELLARRAGINCPISVTGLDSEVAGFLETDRNLPETLNVEVSPEISLLSGMDAIEDSIPQDTEMSEVFQIVSKEDMTENHPFLETVQSSISVDETMAVEFEDLMEPLDDSETLKMLDILENQDGAISMAKSVNKESNALPVELLIALNSLSESAAASVCQPEGKGSWFIIADKQPTPDQTDGDCTQITDINVKSQLHIKHLEETEALMMTKLPYPSEEQIGFSQNMHKLVHSDHQNISSRDRPAEKGDSILKDSSSCEQTIQVASCTLKNSAQKRKKLTLNDTDPTSSCQFLEGMHQNIHSFEAQTRESDTKDKEDDCSQMGTVLCHFSTTDTNTKVEQVRKSQRIAKKRRRQATWNSSSNSSYNYISLSKINRRDRFGQTLLHRAAVEDDLNGLRAMIKAGGNVNTQDCAGWTPLHDSSLAGFWWTTNELLKAGADVNCKGSEKITPLHDAVKGGHYKVAELLLRYGADPLLKNERGKSALEEATDMRMRKLLASFIAKSRRRSTSAERVLEDPVSDQSRIESQPKGKTCSDERVRHTSKENIKVLKQQRVKSEPSKRKRTSQRNYASKMCNSCSLVNATTSEGTCLVSKAKQSVRGRPPSLGASGDKRRINGQRKDIQNGPATDLTLVSERTVGSSEYHQYNSNRSCEAEEDCNMAMGSEMQRESDSNNSIDDCPSERKEALKSTELAGATKDQATNSHTVTSLNPVEEESALASETEVVNEPNLDSTHFLCKDISLPLQEDSQYAMKHNKGSNSLKVVTLEDNLHTAEEKLVWTVSEGIFILASEKNRSLDQYMHSENSVDQINLDNHSLGHELGVKEPLSIAESVCLEENPFESKISTISMLQEIALLSDSDCTVLSEEYNLNAGQNPGENTSRADGICNEQAVHVCMELSSTISQSINRVGVSESPGTCSFSEQRFLTPPVHEGIMMGRAEGNVGKCCFERTGNGSRTENNTVLPSQMLDKDPFQDKSLQTQILGKCYSEKNDKENSNNTPDVSLQSNELETIQSKRMESISIEDCQNAHLCSSNSATPLQFNSTEEQQIPHSLDSSHSSEKEKLASSDQLLCTIKPRINKTNAKGETCLHLAAKKGDLSLVKSLIASGACVNQKDNAGWTAIHEASNKGFTEIIEELLKAGADVNSKSLDGVFPIHDAVSGNHFEAAQCLLLHGANPNEMDDCGNNALDEATCDKMKELLKSYGATETKEAHQTTDVLGEKELHTSRSRKIHSCSSCEEDNMVSQLNSAKQSCDTHESINEVLQNIEEKQDRLLLFELRSQRDADLYIQDLSQIQNILNAVLAKQKSERDDLAKKYRASAESFKQGALREQIAKLVSRQKSLLLMAQKQKELGQKIQNYKNAKKEASHSAKYVPSIHGSCERNNTEDDPSGRIAASSDIAIGLENSWVTDNIYLDQESSQYPNRSLNMSGGNGKEKRQKGLGPKKTASENKPREYNVEKLTKQYSNVSEDLQMQPELESTHSCLATHQKNIPKNRHLLNANLEPAGIFSHALSQSRISPSSSQCSNSQNSEKQLNLKASRRKKNQLLDLLELGKIKSGDDVLEFTVQDSKHKASLLGNGKVRAGNNSVYQNLVQWIKALLGSDISVSWKYVYNKVAYCGTLLSKIIAEVHVSEEPELTVQQNKLFGRNSTRCNYSRGAEYCCFSHKAASSQNAENIRQETAPFPQEEMEISLSPETEAEEIMTAVSETKVPYHLDSSTPPRRFLQFNSRVLIKDEEFMPGHIMDQYWNFYVHCEGFGF
ncbi:QUALITY PROTEIN: ankyrin repeat domain-containing 31 [Podarcis lilfordi]|uniref:QUALITY PROTEIN: ankyrin repeat domain-containing 31 n=1 Tax=Podarcis lilfordi TaxID=74358 RepID=A0AA35L148_9SAUR|nr:QUALITY PROTEIN: ankyrin repeat domain-containing 31 [Podarcis lilfordi]